MAVPDNFDYSFQSTAELCEIAVHLKKKLEADTVNGRQEYNVQSSHYVMRWLELNLHPPLALICISAQGQTIGLSAVPYVFVIILVQPVQHEETGLELFIPLNIQVISLTKQLWSSETRCLFEIYPKLLHLTPPPASGLRFDHAHHTPHVSASRLRNDVVDCVTAPLLIHHVCNGCVFAECVSTCLRVRENICLRQVRSYICEKVWTPVMFLWLCVCLGLDYTFCLCVLCGWVEASQDGSEWVRSQAYWPKSPASGLWQAILTLD